MYKRVEQDVISVAQASSKPSTVASRLRSLVTFANRPHHCFSDVDIALSDQMLQNKKLVRHFLRGLVVQAKIVVKAVVHSAILTNQISGRKSNKNQLNKHHFGLSRLVSCN